MKLVPIATIVGAAMAYSSDNPSPGRFCQNSQSWTNAFSGHKWPKAKEYNKMIQNGLANRDERSLSEICADARAGCAAYDDIDNIDDYDQKTSAWGNTYGDQCGQAANDAILSKMMCSMCDFAESDEEADALAAKLNSAGPNEAQRAVGELEFAGFLGSSMMAGMGLQDEGAEEMASDGPGGERSVPNSSYLQKCGYGAACKVSGAIKQAFGKMTQDLWNIVYSGGPEYCTDMLPRYPKTVYGQMRPGHPNYESVVAIRDACVSLQSLIKSVRCACQYIMWGSSAFPKPSSKSFRMRHGKKEQHMCYYFSNLKGSGVHKPDKKPVSTACPPKKKHMKKSKPKKKPAQSANNRPANSGNSNSGGGGNGGGVIRNNFVTVTMCRTMRNKRMKKFCFQKLKKQGNEGGH